MRNLSAEGVVIVPRRPGPIRLLDHELGGTQDDLDEAIGELFGPEPDDRAGRADLILIVLGAILMAASLVGGGGGLLILGGLMLALGLALPLQAGIRSVRRRRLNAQEKRILAAGYPLDVTTPVPQDLVRAYSRLLERADGVASMVAEAAPVRSEDAVVAAHLALVEAASLLGGRPPRVDAEKEYLKKRTVAINALSKALREVAAAREQLEDTDAVASGSLARARTELEAETGLGSIEDLRMLTRIARRGAADAARR